MMGRHGGEFNTNDKWTPGTSTLELTTCKTYGSQAGSDIWPELRSQDSSSDRKVRAILHLAGDRSNLKESFFEIDASFPLGIL
jgi:hypothetical protein